MLGTKKDEKLNVRLYDNVSDDIKFYVYLYADVDGTPVYVGKGYGDRAWAHLNVTKRRRSNKRLQKLINKRAKDGFGLEPQIIAYGNEDNMMLVEIALINQLGRADLGLGPLYNMTDGGDGASNPSDEIRKKISEASFRRYGEERRFKFIKKKTGEEFLGNCPQFATHIGKDVKAVNRFVREGSDVNSIDGWTLKDSHVVANEYMTKYTFVQPVLEKEFTGTQAEFISKFEVSGSQVSNLVTGRISHLSGWCIKGREGLAGKVRESKTGRWYVVKLPWANTNQTENSLLAWAMAKDIFETFKSLEEKKPDIGPTLVLRSMGLEENISDKATRTVIDYFVNEGISPSNMPEWINFHKQYSKEHDLPENRFDGKLVDSRKKSKLKISDGIESRIIELIEEGSKTKAEIGRELAVSKTTVGRVVERQGLKYSQPKKIREQNEKILSAIKAGELTQEKIAEKFNVSRSVVQRIAKQNNINRSKKTPKEKENRVLKLASQGLGSVEIAKRVGLVRSTVRRIKIRNETPKSDNR